MTFLEVIGIMGGIFKFWDQVVWLVKKLEVTPAEKHAKLVVTIGEEKHSFEETGRPKWD